MDSEQNKEATSPKHGFDADPHITLEESMKVIRDIAPKPFVSYAEQFKPIIFIPRENDLIEVLVEEYPGQICYWYHWPRDGLLPEEDYEPVIVVHNEQQVICVITRRHWDYEVYDKKDEGYEEPLEVIFDGIFHPPYIRRPADSEYGEKKKRLMAREYSFKFVRLQDIPQRFRTGKDHISLRLSLKSPVTDPFLYTTTVVETYYAKPATKG